MPEYLKEGIHNIGGAQVTISAEGKGFSIERIEMPDRLMRHGLMTKIISTLATEAKADKINLSAFVMPDDGDNRELELRMINSLRKVGFASYEADGEVYKQELHLDASNPVDYESKRYIPISPRLVDIIKKLAALKFSENIVVFGSVAEGKELPGDVDIYLDMDDKNPEFHNSKNILLRLAKIHYGSIDPFSTQEGKLIVRNDYASEWMYAKNSKGILDDIKTKGTSLTEVMVSYGIPLPERNRAEPINELSL